LKFEKLEYYFNRKKIKLRNKRHFVGYKAEFVRRISEMQYIAVQCKHRAIWDSIHSFNWGSMSLCIHIKPRNCFYQDATIYDDYRRCFI